MSGAELPDDLRAVLSALLGDPGALGVGLDVEELGRWHAMADRAEQLFRPGEIAYCRAQGVPAQHFAGTWCAKEAVVKAVAVAAAVHVRDVEILRGPDGRPAATADGLALGPGELAVSITHTRSLAAAIAVYRPAGPR